MQSILIFGAQGQLGTELRNLSNTINFAEWTYADIEEVDFLNSSSILNYLSEHETFDWIINCAAYTAVDKAENQPDASFGVNQKAVETIIGACKGKTKLLHISTDYVFDGNNNIPYRESDKANPQGVYGLSKFAGEESIMNSDIDAIIVRTSWLYGVYGQNFVKTMLKLGRDRKEINVVFDQIGSPTSAFDLAHAILEIVKQDLNQVKIHSGRSIFHYSNEGVCSWYDFAKEIFDYTKINCSVYPIESKDYPTPTPRPSYSVLNKEKIKTTYGLSIPHWKDSLHSTLTLLYPIKH